MLSSLFLEVRDEHKELTHDIHFGTEAAERSNAHHRTFWPTWNFKFVGVDEVNCRGG